MKTEAIVKGEDCSSKKVCSLHYESAKMTRNNRLRNKNEKPNILLFFPPVPANNEVSIFSRQVFIFTVVECEQVVEVFFVTFWR